MPAALNLFPAGAVKRSELAPIKMVAGGEKKHSRVIDNGDVLEWVGFGWVNEGPATDEDRRTCPQVVDV